MSITVSSRWIGIVALACLIGLVCAPSASADFQTLLKGKGRQILFLGDSNTFAGGYITYLEGYLLTRFPEENWQLINLGLPSETVSGLSEPDHPYPRPDIHERIDRALDRIKPNVVFVCYGMNDGIYYPYSERRLAQYQKGIEKLVAKIEKAGARPILMTPAPFDSLPVAKNLLPEDAAKFSWMKPYRQYDDVLRKYADYLLEWRKKGYDVIDAHAAMHRLLRAIRETDPRYSFSKDGIHPNATGHAVIAHEILRELNAAMEENDVELDAMNRSIIRWSGGGTVIFSDGEVSFVWKLRLPIPADPRWEQFLQKVASDPTRFDQPTFRIIGLPQGQYEILGNDSGRFSFPTQQQKGKSQFIPLRSATAKELAEAIPFRSLKGLAPNTASEQLGKLIQQRQQLLGLAWLTEIGHKRPGTPRGIPLADALKKAEPLDRQINELIQPRRVEILVRKKDLR